MQARPSMLRSSKPVMRVVVPRRQKCQFRGVLVRVSPIIIGRSRAVGIPFTSLSPPTSDPCEGAMIPALVVLAFHSFILLLERAQLSRVSRFHAK